MGTSRRRGAEELRRTLTRERVVAEALTVIAQEGVEALTMRTLGARLGVVPGALYRHVRGKEQLQDLIVDGVLAEVDRDLDHTLPMAEVFLLPLHNAGFPHREAGHAFFLIVDYTIGFEVSSARISVNEQRVQDAAFRASVI